MADAPLNSYPLPDVDTVGSLAPQKPRIYWWANPSLIVLIFILPIFCLCIAFSDQMLLSFGIKKNYLRDPTAFTIGLFLIFCFLFGGLMARQFVEARLQPVAYMMHDGGSFFRYVSFALLVLPFSSALYIDLQFAANLDLMRDVLVGSRNAPYILRDEIETIPGLTSFVNVSALWLSLVLVRHYYFRIHITRLEMILILFIFVSTALRAVFLLQRLALIELIFPIFIIFFSFHDGKWRNIKAFGPYLGLGGLFALFFATEYFRSWNHYQTIFDNYFTFALGRFLGYYATAVSNGAGAIFAYPADFSAYNTAGWYYAFPLIGPGDEDRNMYSFFRTHGNIELNNPSGIFAPVLDYGFLYAVVVWAIIGFVSGAIFYLFRAGRISGLIMHPTWCLGVYELLRIFYWGTPRYFPAFIMSLIVISALALYYKKARQ